MGLLRLEVKDYDQARKLFERALQIDPKCIPALNNLGVMDHVQGKYDSARENFGQILKIDPKWAKAHFNLAVLYESPSMLDDRKKAIEHYERYLELGGGDRDSEARLAIAELKSKG
jgi:tetratricopeptide (TPR) repeat protein